MITNFAYLLSIVILYFLKHKILDKPISNVKSLILGIKMVFTLDCKKKPKNAKKPNRIFAAKSYQTSPNLA